MIDTRGFYDYGINEECIKNEYEATIKILFDFGYRTIAINQTVDGDEMDTRKKKKKGEAREVIDPVPQPYNIKDVAGCEEMKILNRLTIAFSNQEALHKITKSPNYKKYHLIAVSPRTPGAASFVCSNFEGDIFCFNPEQKSNLKCTRKMYKQLIDKGYFLEIPYSPAIEDSTKRRNIIYMSHQYHAVAKSKQVIISSFANNPIYLRGPYDVINLGFIFGLNELQAKNAVSSCGRQLFISSVGRRLGRAIMLVENVQDELKPSSPPWTITVKENLGEVIDLMESDNDIVEINEPSLKRIKQ